MAKYEPVCSTHHYTVCPRRPQIAGSSFVRSNSVLRARTMWHIVKKCVLSKLYL